MAHMDRDDWLHLGLAALGESGADALRLEAVTARAGRTRGSFYHHFKSHPAFVAEIVALWRRRAVEALPPQGETPGSVGDALDALTAGLQPRLEAAIRGLAEGDAALGREVAAADAARIAHLRAHQADPESPAAEDYAAILYAVVIGLLTIRPATQSERLAALAGLAAEMIAAHWNE